ARAHVTRCVDAGGARLQQSLYTRVLAGEDEPVLVPGDGVSDPAGAWVRSEEESQRAEREAFTALQGHRLELAVGAVQLGDLAAVANVDAGAVEVGDQVVGHR